jgi:sporulation protein YlmC with PRC-barrel domain
MKISDLDGLPIFNPNGDRLGHVYEVLATNGQITDLVYGAGGLIARLIGMTSPETVPWANVQRLGPAGITLK